MDHNLRRFYLPCVLTLHMFSMRQMWSLFYKGREKGCRENTFLRSESQPGRGAGIWIQVSLVPARKCSPLHNNASQTASWWNSGVPRPRVQALLSWNELGVYTPLCLNRQLVGSGWQQTELSSALRDGQRDGMAGGGDIYIYVWLIRFVVEQKPT